jgi:hypothetical protein
MKFLVVLFVMLAMTLGTLREAVASPSLPDTRATAVYAITECGVGAGVAGSSGSAKALGSFYCTTSKTRTLTLTLYQNGVKIGTWSQSFGSSQGSWTKTLSCSATAYATNYFQTKAVLTSGGATETDWSDVRYINSTCFGGGPI